MNNLDDLRYVAAIAAAGTLSGAARRLKVNHATVFRRLVAIEAELGLTLFLRESGRYVPTDAGEALARRGDQFDELIEESMQRFRTEAAAPVGLVRMTTTESIASGLICPILASLRRELPLIRLELNIASEITNLSKREADIAVRATNEPPEHLVGNRLCTLSHAVYASAAYLEANPSAELVDHDWLALDDSLSQTASVRWLQKRLPLDTVALRANSYKTLQNACAAGLGLSILPCFLGDADPELVRRGSTLPECATSLWILTHPDLVSIHRVNAVVQFLGRELGCRQRLIAGDPDYKNTSSR